MCYARTIPLIAAFVAIVAPGLSAQGTPPGFLAEFDEQFGASADKLVALAKVMPESTYEWTPMEGVASVARVYMHIARYNYAYPEGMGVESPMGASVYDTWEEGVTDKAEVVSILEASMEHVRGVAEKMGAMGMEGETELYGRDVGEWAVLFQLITHMNEHLGQSIAYARMNHVVPPWSV
jgi:uncharacterized damage-inducible protein DinB